MKSSNPFFNNKSFSPTSRYGAQEDAYAVSQNETMTVKGAINKSMFLFAILVTSAFFAGYLMLFQGVHPYALTLGGGITGFIIVIIAGFKPNYSGVLAPAYSVFKGLFVGGISVVLEVMYPGVVLKAVGGTLVTFMVCFLLYRFGIVKVTEQFKSVVIASVLAIMTYYLISWIISMFTGNYLVGHSFQDSSLMSIGISVFVIVVAALTLFLDFDMIEQGAQRRLPKYMEWFGAMGLMITLVWLYMEFLKLFAKISGRD
ncbi:Bax inhibitor-1/YccA family protein [Flavobacterium sp. MFBS3-15]|uniref:Bax inhibitor-1/YccA family protein n=1 Tax=Flavobacterium sp. MFBS3-15 TaxID=2989816 RepID=UPI002236BA70|nr:Bax inhibitor-1/YccA family protein [Flavobacterium sp. MFBS3-15]MCW4470002.1 Bax inhibitor-1/YccA family protein [Flavobacterium sp. MFBS3-15]